MAVNIKELQLDTYSPNQTRGIYKKPIVSKSRAPGTGDKAEIGTIWIDQTANSAYILTTIAANLANWENFTDEVTAVGTDGQLWIGATGAAAAWANLTSTGLSVTITNTANGVNLEAAGVAALTTLDGDSGTATPVAGVIIIAGGTNITTAGAAGTLTVNLDASPSVDGTVTAATGFVASGGVTTITATTDQAQAILLTTNAGTSETIDIYAQQGTAVNSIDIYSDAGGIAMDAALAAADAITIDASDAAGGIQLDGGTGGILITAANGEVRLASGTAAVNIGADAAAHTVTVGSTTTTAATVLQSGTGDTNITSADAINLDAVGVLEFNSSAGVIGIGNDAVAQNINIGTGAAARTITIGNGTNATAVDINCGTGDATFATNATAHSTTIGSTNTTSNVIVQSGTGGTQVTSGGTYNVDAVGAVAIESSGSTIGIGVDAVAQNMNIGTGAAARVITVGNATGATDLTLTAGTAGITLSAAGIVDMVPATGTFAGAAVTISANVGVGTFTGLTTAAAAAQVFTITNTICTTGSAIFVSASNLGANDAQMTVTRVTPGAGTFDVTLTNNGAAALNGDVLISFWIIAA